MNETIFTMNQEIIKLVSDGIDFVQIPDTKFKSLSKDLEYIKYTTHHGVIDVTMSLHFVYETINENDESVYSLDLPEGEANEDEDEETLPTQIATVGVGTLTIQKEDTVHDKLSRFKKIFLIIIKPDDRHEETTYYATHACLDFLRQREKFLIDFLYSED